MPTVTPDELRDFSRRLLVALGSPESAARTVAGHLVDANLAGHDSHGVIRLPQYAEQVAAGQILHAAQPSVLSDAPAAAVVDGGRTWGPVAANFATELLQSKANAAGFAGVGVRNAGHVGRLGAYVGALAEAGLVAQAWCNIRGVVRMAPWGGTEARLGTNPIAIALPARGRPFVLDMTTTVVAEGKVRVAKIAGKSIPKGWVLDRAGAPTENPADLYDGGTLLPLGDAAGYKGFGLAFIADALAGILGGPGCGAMPGVPYGNGLFLTAFRPDAILPRGEYESRLEEFVGYLKSSPRAAGVEEILLPGEIEARTATARAKGIPVEAGAWKQLTDLAAQLAVAPPAA